MRNIHFALVLLMVLAFVGCKDDETFGEDSAACDQAWADMVSETFSGSIYRCDYSDLTGRATVVRGSGDVISIHLVADSIAFDTTMFFTAHCHLAERTIPQIKIKHAALDHDFGYYTTDSGLSFVIPYTSCHEGSTLVFSGYAL